MQSRNPSHRALLGALATTALALLAGPPAAQAAAGPHAAPARAAYLSGGISKDEEIHMQKIAGRWPLRMIFSERRDNEFVAAVKLKVTDAKGHQVLALDNAGPMTYAKVPPGDYRVVATFHGTTEVRDAKVDPKKGADVYFHWKGKRAIDPWDGKPMGGKEVPG